MSIVNQNSLEMGLDDALVGGNSTANAFKTFGQRNFSVNQSTLADSNLNLNITKLTPLESRGEKRKSIEPTAVRIVSNLVKRDDKNALFNN